MRRSLLLQKGSILIARVVARGRLESCRKQPSPNRIPGVRQCRDGKVG